MKKIKTPETGDYIIYIVHPYEVLSEGLVTETVNETLVKVNDIDGMERYVSVEDIRPHY